jgi:hypothetical protein
MLARGSSQVARGRQSSQRQPQGSLQTEEPEQRSSATKPSSGRVARWSVMPEAAHGRWQASGHAGSGTAEDMPDERCGQRHAEVA